METPVRPGVGELREDVVDMSSAGTASQPVKTRTPVKETTDVSKNRQGSESQPHKMRIDGVDFYYGKSKALHNISLGVQSNQVTAFIGPSGCGKSTLLRALNRMHDLIPRTRLEGKVELDGEDIYAPGVDVDSLRRRVGMVFQK